MSLSETISGFLSCGAYFFKLWQIEQVVDASITAVPKGEDPTPLQYRLMESQFDRFGQWESTVAIGRELAAALEQHGHNSTRLLAFLSSLDVYGGGGPEAAAARWPGVKAELERVLIRCDLGDGGPVTDPAADDGMVQILKLDWPREFKEYKKKTKFLKENGIANVSKGKRRWVNARQFVEAMARRNKRASESLDGDPETLFPEQIPADAFADEARKRKDAIRKGWTDEETKKRAGRKR